MATMTETVPSLTTLRTHPVVLKTRTQYVIPSEQYMIPTTWRRFHLSQLINKVLALPQPVPFDFIVKGEMLRTSLGDWCSERAVEEEETLEIEYIESVLPPERVSSMPHPDWVSSISCNLKGYFLTGSYDSTVRLYNESQQLLSTIAGHSAPVSSVCIIPKHGDAMAIDDNYQLIASASYDTTARIVSVPLGGTSGDDDEDRETAKPLTSLHLHTAAVSSIASNAAGSNLLTASWDSLIGVWSTSIPTSDEVDVPTFDLSNVDRDRKKRRKVTKAADALVTKAPQSVLKSHTGRISSVQWSPTDSNMAYSCGWDFTVRAWDVEAGVCTATLTAPEKAMLDLAVTCDGRTIATANGDRTVSLFQAANAAALPVHLPHTSSVTAISAHPISPHHIVSGCMDGTVRIWDLRSTQGAVESFVAQGDANKEAAAPQKSKILSLNWSRGSLVGCAGELGIDIFKVNVGN